MNILEGITIADFSRVFAGPDCSMWLADLGATVLKIESPQGDDTRHWKPSTFNDTSTYYLSVNRNKQSILLDLNNPDDLKHAHRIVEQSDVLIENFKPGGRKKNSDSTTVKHWPDTHNSSTHKSADSAPKRAQRPPGPPAPTNRRATKPQNRRAMERNFRSRHSAMRSHPHRARRRATRPSTRARSRDNHRRHPPDAQPRNLQPYPR